MTYFVHAPERLEISHVSPPLLLAPFDVPKGDDGLCWWTPDTLTPDTKKPDAGKRRPDTRGERGEQGVEFHTAAVAAQACGARVLLGDRDLEVCVGVAGMGCQVSTIIDRLSNQDVLVFSEGKTRTCTPKPLIRVPQIVLDGERVRVVRGVLDCIF